jgi:hypothetical protein
VRSFPQLFEGCGMSTGVKEMLDQVHSHGDPGMLNRV